MLVSARLRNLHAGIVRAGVDKLQLVIARTCVLFGSVIVALGLGSPAALAQNCASPIQVGTVTVTAPPLNQQVVPVQLISPSSAAIAGNAAVSGALAAVNAAFLTQSTAFVSNPANAKPDSEGAGIWTRLVGGELTLNSNSQVNASSNFLGALVGGSTTCSTQFHEAFGGFQLGTDVAKFNIGGWNLTLGTTAGFLQTNGNLVGGNNTTLTPALTTQGFIDTIGGGFNSTTQAPFVGAYGFASYGNFFFDSLVRADYFQTNLNSPAANLYNQKIDSHGFTVAASAGYNWKIPNSSWFIEPSASVIWSRETVDPLDVSSTALIGLGNLFSGTANLNELQSINGRAGLRVGTTLETRDVIFSPFAAASVWHDFAGDSTANFTTCPGCVGAGFVAANISTNNIGTFGQYSVGVSGQIKNTGWVGFGRVDYREGPQISGLSGTGGIRYQFSPTATALPVKAKTPGDHPANWTGWYGGVIGGATELGSAAMTFPGTSTAQTRPSGWLGGGTLGYNFQSGNWVYGLEGDIEGTGTNGSAPCAPLTSQISPVTLVPNPVALFNTTCHDSLDWIATATARLGYAWTPRSLLYVKAGGAFADERASVTCNWGSPALNMVYAVVGSGPCVDPALTHLLDQASVSTFRAGWTVGIGTEFALTDHWSIKGEFDWLDFGTRSLTLSDGTPFNSTLHVAEGKIGLNYKFWPAGPDSVADLAVLPTVKVGALPVKAAPAPATTWDGFYLGASVGWDQTSSKWNTGCFALPGIANCGQLLVDTSSPHTFDPSGMRVGTYFGINWQVAPSWLVGVEADVGYNDKTSTVTGIVGCTTFCGVVFAGRPQATTAAFDSTSIRTSWDGSLRARAGYLVTPALLVYGAGGFAERMIDANVTCDGNTSPWCIFSQNQTYAGHLQAGWTVGGGVEWKVLNNVLLRSEYRYSDYGSWSPMFTGPTVPTSEILTNISSHSHSVLFGASYLFGGRPVN